MGICLTPDELQEITGKQRYSAQARELDRMGIRYTRRKDRSLMVLRENLTNETAKERQTPPPLCFPEARRVLVREGRKVEAPRGRAARSA